MTGISASISADSKPVKQRTFLTHTGTKSFNVPQLKATGLSSDRTSTHVVSHSCIMGLDVHDSQTQLRLSRDSIVAELHFLEATS